MRIDGLRVTIGEVAFSLDEDFAAVVERFPGLVRGDALVIREPTGEGVLGWTLRAGPEGLELVGCIRFPDEEEGSAHWFERGNLERQAAHRRLIEAWNLEAGAAGRAVVKSHHDWHQCYSEIRIRPVRQDAG